ncbi:MAG: CHAT domain-containing protein [Gemmatimonadaceae bacterium]
MPAPRSFRSPAYTLVARSSAIALLTVLACRASDSRDAKGAASITRGEFGTSVRSADPLRLARLLKVPVDSLRAAAEERYARQSYDSAADILKSELVRATRAGDRNAEARAHMWLGMAAWRLGDYPLARTEGERSIAMKRSLHMDAELSRSFNVLGLLAWNEGRERAALELFDSAIVSARRNKDLEGLARSTANVPLVKVELGDFDGARRGFATALAASLAASDERLEANDLTNLAMLDIRVGDAARALPLLAQARQHYRALAYETGESNALGQLATAWTQLGDLQRAIGAADSALAIARAQGLKQEIASDLEVIADLNAKAGDSQLALRRLSMADSIDSELGLSIERGTNLRRMATILLALGDTAGSILRARQALSNHRRAEAHAEAIYDRLQLARGLSDTRSVQAAWAEMDSASREARAVHSPAVSRDVAAFSAQLALDAHDPARALNTLAELDVAPARRDWATSDLRAQALLALGRLEPARQESERAVAALERERASLDVGPLRSGYLADRVAPYSHLVAIHIARRDTASAFKIAASVPGRSLAERLGSLTDTPPSIAGIAEGEKLLLRSASLEEQLRELEVSPKDLEQRAFLERALESTQTEYTEYLSRRGRVGSAMLAGAPMGAAQVQGRLAPRQALVLFLCGPERLDAFLVRQNRIAYYAIPIGSQSMEARIRVVRELMTRPSELKLATKALGDLHQILFGRWDSGGEMRGVDHLAIVAHGPLTALPFAALWNQASGKFMVEDYAIATLPSLAAEMSTRREARANLSGMVVLAPLANKLTGTRREATAIAEDIPTAQIKLGSASSELAARTALAAGRPIHIASHGTHNAQNPLFSRMVVGSPKNGATEDDGALEVHEILGLSTTSPLVYLSGCETALAGAADNSFKSAADENSLAQAFLIAGARTVVATLWKVDDAAAAAIANGFYHQLQAGAYPQDALAKTQRTALKGGRNLTWAAYTVSTAGLHGP